MRNPRIILFVTIYEPKSVILKISKRKDYVNPPENEKQR